MKNYLPTEERKQMFKYPSIYDPGLSKYMEQHLFKFENGCGASAIKEVSANLYELAVITWREGHYFLNFDNAVCNDVTKFQTIEEVNNLLDQIKKLGGNTNENKQY